MRFVLLVIYFHRLRHTRTPTLCYACGDRAVATLNRGFVANEADRADIEELVEMLELENPNPRACAGFATGSSPIAGKWQ